MAGFIKRFKGIAPNFTRKAALCLSVSALLFAGSPASNAALPGCIINNSGDCVGPSSREEITSALKPPKVELDLKSATDLLGSGKVIIEKLGGGDEAEKAVGDLKKLLDDMPPELKNAALSKVAEAAQGSLNLDQLKNLVGNLSSLVSESKLISSAITAAVSTLAGGGDASSFFKTMMQQMLQGTPLSSLTSGAFNPQKAAKSVQKQFGDSQFASGNFDSTAKLIQGEGDGTLSAKSPFGSLKDVQYRNPAERNRLDVLMKSKGCLRKEPTDNCPKVPINVNLYERINEIEHQLGGGDIVFHITSGYRSKAHNSAVSRATKSRHMQNDAMDFSAYRGGSRIANSQIIKKACALRDKRNSGGVGGYGPQKHVHVDTRSGKSTWGSPRCG
jgi:uncharacterized protein YcbK (DUF882 family)